MAARRNEISLRVLKNISRVSEANEKRILIFPSGHVIFYLLDTSEILNHFTKSILR